MIKELECNYHNNVIVGDHYYSDNNPIGTLLLLHGGGLKTTRKVYEKMRMELLKSNIESYAFDFIGHGDNNEELYNTNLHSMVLQAKTFIDKFIGKPFAIIGDSMSGYVAIKLLEMYDFSSIILFVPAVYSDEAYDINFGSKFSEIIRKENSWDNSNAYDIINKYSKNVLLISAENDSVIPIGVTNKLKKSFSSANKVFDYTIKDGTHNMFTYIYDSEEYKKICSLIIKCIEK